MDKTLDDQVLVIQTSVDTNKQDIDEFNNKMKKHDSDFINIKY